MTKTMSVPYLTLKVLFPPSLGEMVSLYSLQSNDVTEARQFTLYLAGIPWANIISTVFS